MKKKKKKRLILIGIILIVFLGYFLIYPPFKNVNFSETNGKITDDKGNAVKSVNVYIDYSCLHICVICQYGNELVFYHHEETKSDLSGVFKFDSWNSGPVRNFPFHLYDCKKTLSFAKRGYSGEVGKGRIFDCWDQGCLKEINIDDKDFTYILIKQKETEVKGYPCKIYRGDCTNNKILGEVILTKNVSRCSNQYDVPNYLFYPCYVEIAIAEKNPSVCDEITYGADVEITNGGYSEKPEIDTNNYRESCKKEVNEYLLDYS